MLFFLFIKANRPIAGVADRSNQKRGCHTDDG
jgi:hypothetical protein